MAESAAAWQTQQKEKATTTKIKVPEIPGDYGSPHEGFSVSNGVSWFAVIGGATLLLIAIHCVNGLNKR
jgi:hypothetical protein